jgi:hypothetical protein
MGKALATTIHESLVEDFVELIVILVCAQNFHRLNPLGAAAIFLPSIGLGSCNLRPNEAQRD